MGQAQSKHATYLLIGAAALLGSVSIAAHSRAKCQLDRKENGDRSTLELKESMRHIKPQDHPLVAWVIENSCVLLVGLFIPTVPIPDLGVGILNKLKLFFQYLLTSFARVEAMTLLQHLLVYGLYSHIPFFSKPDKRPKSEADAVKSLKDWVSCNLVINSLGSIALVSSVSNLNEKQIRSRLRSPRFRLLPFLLKFAFARVVFDIMFYIIHRAIHLQPLYKWIHKRHHEHNNCALVTNFHFTALDLLLEAFIPGFVSVETLASLPLQSARPSEFESRLIFLYLLWFEIGSHSGKNVPTLSFFPPLSCVYGYVWPEIDADTVRHHETHHNRVTCNYGITNWIDIVMGTRRKLCS